MKDATIKLVTLTNKKNEKNEVPIYVRACYQNKQKVKFTGVWISEKNWDKKTERIASRERNSATLNKCIQNEKQAVIDRLDLFISQGKPYTLSDLFATDEVRNQNELKEILKLYHTDRRSKFNTKEVYSSAVNKFEEFIGRTATIQDVTKRNLLDYLNWMLDVKKLSNNSVRNYFGRLQAIMSYAVENEMISPTANPFLYQNFIRRIPSRTKHKALTEQQLDLMKEMFLSYYEIDPISNAYRQIKKERKVKFTSDFFSLKFFLLMYYLQGLSPRDILMLKKSQFKEEKTIGKYGEEIYNISISDVYRSKTNVKVHISFEKTLFTSMLIDQYLYSDDGEYFLPFLNDISNRNGRRINSFVSNLNTALKFILQRINDIIDERELVIPKIVLKDISIYSARHTFASVAVHKGIGLQELASMMGRSLEYISVYIQDFITSEEVRIARQNTIDVDY